MILFCSTAHQGKCVFCTPFLTVVHHSIFNTISITKLHYCEQTQCLTTSCPSTLPDIGKS